MPDFTYIARDPAGAKITGILTAPTRRDVLAQLDKRSLFPVTVDLQEKGTSGSRALANVTGGRQRRVKPQLLATTYGQLAGLLRSGVPLLRSLKVLQEQSSHAGLKEVLSQVHGKVEEGSTLAEAFARHPRAFSEMAVSMVRAGGEGGFLEDALMQVADFTEKQEEMKSRTVGALVYPMILAVVGVSVVTVLVVFFVPKFEVLFATLRQKGELPAVTDMLLWTSSTLGHWGWLFALAIAAGVTALRRWLKTEPGRLQSDRLKLRVPVVGNIFLNLGVSRFCRVLGTLLHNGVPILRSMEISSSATGNRVLSQAVDEAAENISAGQSLAVPLAASGHFPRNVTEMIAVAEESNSLERVLSEISDSLDRRTWRQLDLFVRLLEPLMLMVLAGVVLVIVIALLLPVLKMSNVM